MSPHDGLVPLPSVPVPAGAVPPETQANPPPVAPAGPARATRDQPVPAVADTVSAETAAGPHTTDEPSDPDLAPDLPGLAAARRRPRRAGKRLVLPQPPAAPLTPQQRL